ncbi:tRNA uridine-5-carboxymethylaminomethyl(34) synthesis GTPase MnmE [Alkalitalea saponilacus]|uniref:tRNA modification GTPase MnmE n=1 Tax=Alkalitalea saponilacus TaxID=889453 RepID=A0A1T5D5M0_9BACT|nr:tRNA uridine-5-carboxymethylaminomethyl(34) synthesis GTPase MnmE [Alkalitalea saponilacus]ASB50584.1 tRNA uridine-5-carboxymethylaminomethyl(34) synthesis GTPase MnmE [Alkalitalea saponilacus]SKB66917.1 tRNA modification GTPase [Alkalitalea saponilacus]
MTTNDTICAISTAKGMGAIAVIRIAGENAFKITDIIFKPAKKGKIITEQPANSIHFGTVCDGDSEIDEVLVSVFKAPHSFTGDDIIEIACHGAPYIQQQLLQLLTKHGARLAEPGEFTQRAFLNGKMDLSQAEAVADLIASQSEAARRVALQQMRGGFSSELMQLRERLLWFISMIELELDFSEEDVEFANRDELNELVDEITSHIERLVKSFSLGNAIKNGIPVAIAGHTNAGKSTLLNALLNEERAIVSDIHGTTRDAIEDTINIEGISFRFIDTAGIRSTADAIENLGIELTYSKIKQASIVLLLVDVTDADEKIHEAIQNILSKLESDHQQLIVVVNKTDLAKDDEIERRFSHNAFKELTGNNTILPISAKFKTNLDNLTIELLRTVNLSAIDSDDVIVTNARHHEALSNALESITRVKEGLNSNISGDFLAQDIREVLHYLGSITGQISTDEILGNIFKNFCIGK